MKAVKFKVDGAQTLDGLLLRVNPSSYKDEATGKTVDTSTALVQVLAAGPVHNRLIEASAILPDEPVAEKKKGR